MAYSTLIIVARKRPGDSSGWRVELTTQPTARLPRVNSDRMLVVIGGSDDAIVYSCRIGGELLQGLADGVDDAMQVVIMRFLVDSDFPYAPEALESAFGNPGGEAEFIERVARVVDARRLSASATGLGQWQEAVELPLWVGLTTVDWASQRWQFGRTADGLAIWDTVHPEGPVELLGDYEKGFQALARSVWQRVGRDLVASTSLNGPIEACAVTPIDLGLVAASRSIQRLSSRGLRLGLAPETTVILVNVNPKSVPWSA